MDSKILLTPNDIVCVGSESSIVLDIAICY